MHPCISLYQPRDARPQPKIRARHRCAARRRPHRQTARARRRRLAPRDRTDDRRGARRDRRRGARHAGDDPDLARRRDGRRQSGRRRPQPARLFLYHKPPGLLVTERDPEGRPTIYDRLPDDLPRVVPVGRLDLNTEGLLLLTTDGELKRQLELPATGVERAYRARAYGQVTQAQLEELIEGVEIEGVRYGSIDANLERRTGANVWIEMILTEGKNREVRRVLEYLGLQVSRLIRTRYGPFVLGDLRGRRGRRGARSTTSSASARTRRAMPPTARAAKPTEAGRGTRTASRAPPPRPRRDADTRPKPTGAKPQRRAADRPTTSAPTAPTRRRPPRPARLSAHAPRRDPVALTRRRRGATRFYDAKPEGRDRAGRAARDRAGPARRTVAQRRAAAATSAPSRAAPRRATEHGRAQAPPRRTPRTGGQGAARRRRKPARVKPRKTPDQEVRCGSSPDNGAAARSSRPRATPPARPPTARARRCSRC